MAIIINKNLEAANKIAEKVVEKFNRLNNQNIDCYDFEIELKCGKYFHITKPEFAETIKKNGLKANSDGYISLCTELFMTEFYHDTLGCITDIIADQVYEMDKYILIEIDPKGIKADLVSEIKTSDITENFQKRINQSEISPEFIKITLYRDIEQDWLEDFCDYVEDGWFFLAANDLDIKVTMPIIEKIGFLPEPIKLGKFKKNIERFCKAFIIQETIKNYKDNKEA
ncbi:MAG: hypothetical protein WCO13_13565 [Bacteroidota bacterium]